MLKPIILLSSLLLFSGSLLAKTHIQNSDPLKIRSDRVNFDDNKGLAIYSGAVEVEQRNKILKAHEMYVYRLNQKINKIEAFGNLASFEIKSDNKEPLFGQALSIYYFPLDKKIVLIGKALLTQNKDSVQGDKITYYLETGILNAEASKNNRTTVIIAPESLKNS